MTNRQIAAVLFNISAILKQQNGNPYRIRAYRRAAQELLRMREQVADRLDTGKSLGLPRLGPSLTAKVTTLAREGRLPFYEELCDSLPEDMRTLLRVPGLGPTIAGRICRDIGPTDAAGLRRAVAAGRIQRVWGVGPKRTAAIANALGSAGAQQERLPL
jgi:DNA polymerase (family 10)